MTAYGLGYTSVPPRLRYAGPAPSAPSGADETITARLPPSKHVGVGGAGEATDWMGRLLAYIPGDIVGVYLLLTNPAQPVHYKGWAWIVFGVLVPVSVLVVYSGYYVAKKRNKANSEPKPWFRLFATPVAFTVWAISLPRSPFDSVAILSDGAVKSGVLLIGTIIIVAAASIWDANSSSA